MIFSIYKKALAVMAKHPFVLWGISLLNLFLAGAAYALFGIIPGLALAIVWLLNTSMTLIYLHGYRGNQVKVLQLFDCFRDWATIKRVLIGMSWMTLWIVLWGLIPVVGIIFAIIRVYRYRLTPYILMQEPDVPPTEAIKLSKQRTQGWKGRMFWADVLSYVAVYVIILILTILTRIPFIGVLFGIIEFLCIIVVAAFMPLFLGLTHAAFYEEIKAAANSSKKCPSCGNYVHAHSAYCQYCGAPMYTAAAAPAPEMPNDETAAPAAPAAPEAAPAPAAEDTAVDSAAGDTDDEEPADKE